MTSGQSLLIMTLPQDIPSRSVSHSAEQMLSASLSASLGTSPLASFNPGTSWGTSKAYQRVPPAEKPLKPFNTQDVKILLLENVNTAGQELLRAQGYQVEALKTSLPEDQLIEKIR